MSQDAAKQLLNLTQKELDRLPPDMRDKIEAVRKQVFAAQRLRTVQSAKDSLLDFVQMSMPDPAHPDDATKSRYEIHKVHEFLAKKLEAVERGEILRLCISVQPRIGKSELVSKKFPAWIMGRDPYKQIILAGYGDEFVKEFGREVRNTMLSPFYQQVFPGTQLHRNAKAANRQQTTAGGILTFAGLGGQLTGKGADCVLPYCTVDTDKGSIPIEHIKVGDRVYGYDHKKGRPVGTTVRAVSAKQTVKPLVAVGNVHCTADHRIYTAEQGYVTAAQAGRLSGLWRQEGVPRANVSHMPESAHAVLADLDVRPMRQRVSAGAVGTQKGHRQVRTESQNLLQPAMLPAVASRAPRTEKATRRMRGMWSVFNGKRAKEILRSALLRAEAGKVAVYGRIFGQIFASKSLCVSEGQNVPVVWDAPKSYGSASHRPQLRTQHGEQPSAVMRTVSSAVSHVHGVSANDIKGTLCGKGEYVVDIQTDTENFFCEGLLVHNCLIIDDPIKNAEDARSKATKDKLWEGFIRDAMSRLMGKAGAVVVTATRWAEDDLIGRLTDPELGYVTEEDAAQWEVVNIPAFAEEDDPLGRPVGEILWEDRTPRAFLESFRRLDPAGFAALYMGRPAPPEGNFFKREHIKTYQPHELPSNLRYYAASDHAISTEQNRDSTCMGVVGVDGDDTIWVLPDLVWAQLPSEDQVEAMLALMQQHAPLLWWAEKGHISKSIGPFLRKRMQEEQVYVSIVEKTPVKDKQTRAQSIQARMSMGKVMLPAFAPWYGDAVEQLLNFPNGAHDDFCVAEGTLICMADGSQKPVESVETGEHVLTPTGSHQVTDSQCTNAAADVFKVTFDDGTHLIATGNHPVGIGSGIFVRVDRLTRGRLVSCVDQPTQEGATWLNEELQKRTCGNTKGTVTAGTLTASTRTTVATFMRRSLEGAFSIGTYGKMLMGKSPLVSTFTTRTKTPLTTALTTWSACPQEGTEQSICENGVKPLNIWLTLNRYAPLLRSGISQTKAGSGTARWLSKRGTNENALRKRASSAARRLRRLFLTEHCTVAQSAATKRGTKRITKESSLSGPENLATTAARSLSTHNAVSDIAALSVGTKRVVAVDRLPEKRPVHNLTVDTAHVYFANGTLTHNCDFMAWIGLGLTTQVRAQTAKPKVKEPPSGSLEWILNSANRIRKRNAVTEHHERYLH